MSAKNKIHRADLLFLPYDTVRVGIINKAFRYAFNVVDVGTRYKEAESLTSKDSMDIAKAFEEIYSKHLKYPKLLQVDLGREFMGAVSHLMGKRGVRIRRGETKIYRDQGIVERFNGTLAERLFGNQYAQKLENPQKRNREWIMRLPTVVKSLNAETKKNPSVVTRKTGAPICP